MKFFETIVKILGSAWGVWSIVAFAFGIFFWITSAAIKKAKITTLSPDQSYRFFRLGMVLAFVLAIASLITGTLRESIRAPSVHQESNEERIRKLAHNLKSPDPTTRRHAVEALVPHGGAAARELVHMISEEVSVAAADMFVRVTHGDLSDFLSQLLGAPPWRTPFMVSATDALIAIGKPSIPSIFDQLASESIGAERILVEVAEQSTQAKKKLNALEAFQQWGFLFGATREGLRIGITRETLANALRGIGPEAMPELLDALESPRLLLRMTSYEILTKMPGATAPTIQRLKRLAEHAKTPEERDQILAAIKQLENDPLR